VPVLRSKETLNRSWKQETTYLVDAGRRCYAKMLRFNKGSGRRRDDKSQDSKGCDRPGFIKRWTRHLGLWPNGVLRVC
jgi:hypothetical protein